MRRTTIRFAERHHGLVTRAHLVAAGDGPGRIAQLRRTRRLRVVRRGVYAAAGAPRSWEQGLEAVLFAVASHESALRLLGSWAGGEPYEITTPRHRQVRMHGVRAHRAGSWLPEDRRTLKGMPCTSPARTVVDLSGRLGTEDLGRLVDDLVRRRHLRLRDLARTVGRLGAGPGRRPSVVNEILRARAQGYEPGDSDLEARVIRLLAAAGLPAPTAQHRVKVDGKRYRVDLAYPTERIAIEIDSWAYHRWRSAFDGDRARRNDLTILGYRVLQVTDGMADSEVVRTVRRALDAMVQ